MAGFPSASGTASAAAAGGGGASTINVQRARTVLTTNVSNLAVTIDPVDVNKSTLNLISFRNPTYPNYRCEGVLENSTTLRLYADATGFQTNWMAVSWEVIEHV